MNKLNMIYRVKYLRIFSYVVFALLVVVFQGCENEDICESQDYGFCDVRKIEYSELPDGVKPIVVNSKEEFDNLISQLNQLKVTTTDNNANEIISNIDGELVIGVTVKKFEEFNTVRLKSTGAESGIVDVEAPYVGGLSVLIHLAYSSIGGSITVTSTESSSTFFLGWEQTAATASWGSNNRINYSVRGDVVTYVLFETSLFEISRTNYKIEGYVNR